MRIKRWVSCIWMMSVFYVLGCSSLYAQGPISVEGAWVRAVPAVSKNTAAYLRLKNQGSQEDALLSVSTPVAEVIELHHTQKKGAMLSMQHRSEILIPAQQITVLKPGESHIMLLQLKAPLKEGEHVPLTLHFRKAKAIKVMAIVSSRTTSPETHHHHH